MVVIFSQSIALYIFFGRGYFSFLWANSADDKVTI